MKQKNLSLVFMREYTTRVKNKWFLITTFLVPIAILIMMAIGGFFSYQATSNQNEKNILLADPQEYISPDDIPASSDYIFTSIQQSLDQQQIQAKLYEENYYAVLVIPSSLNDQSGTIEIASYQKPDTTLRIQPLLQSSFAAQIVEYKIAASSLDPAALAFLQTDVRFSTQTIDISGETRSETDDASFLAYVLGYVSGFFIYMTLIIYGTIVMRGVMEEKLSRVVEIVISSVQPSTLMLGKILGIAAMSITQIVIRLVSIALLTTIAYQLPFIQASIPFTISDLSTLLSEANMGSFLFYFPFFYIGGYLLYAGLFAAVGASVENDRDAQSLTFPITVPIIIAFIAMFSVLDAPYSMMAQVLSYIPLTSPIIMMARLPFGIAWRQVVLSIIILFGSFYTTTLIAAKIYRTGILMYGKKATFKDIRTWIRA